MPLEGFLHDAKSEGLKELKLIKAERDSVTGDFVWCTHYGEVVEKSECKKSECAHYKSKSGRGVCADRGKLYLHGEEVAIDVSTGKELTTN